MLDLNDPDIREDFQQDRAPTRRYAGCQINIGSRPGVRPVAVVHEASGRQTGRVVAEIAPEPIPGCPEWVGRCDALFHARLAAYRLCSPIDEQGA